MFIGLGGLWFLVTAVPDDWLGLGGDETSSDECEAEFTPELAAAMHTVYFGFIVVQISASFINGLDLSFYKAAKINDKGNPTAAVNAESELVPYWFWFLVLYFAPYDDAALPMVAECTRLVINAVSELMESQDFFLLLSSQV
mgnify:CR=1 FL=1